MLKKFIIIACALMISVTISAMQTSSSSGFWQTSEGEVGVTANFHFVSKSENIDEFKQWDIYPGYLRIQNFIDKTIPRLYPGKKIMAIKYFNGEIDIDLTQQNRFDNLSKYIGHEATPQFEVVLE